jgi:hypothetical protein
LNREVYDQIVRNIEHNTFMFSNVNNERVAFTLSGNDEAHTLNTFKRFEVVRIAGRVNPFNAMLYRIFGTQAGEDGFEFGGDNVLPDPVVDGEGGPDRAFGAPHPEGGPSR